VRGRASAGGRYGFTVRFFDVLCASGVVSALIVGFFALLTVRAFSAAR